MDNDRYRSTGRRIVNGSSAETNERPAPARPVEEVQPPRAAVAQGSPRQSYEQPVASTGKKRGFVWVIAGLLIIVILAVSWFFWQQQKEQASTGIDTSKYQAVFLSNGQHYFGKLERMNDEYFKLRDVYYLEQKNGSDSEAATAKQTAVELRKLGDKEVHGPENEMVIAKSHVLLYENLKDKSQVVTLINQQKQQAN